ncbi:MAG TPA: glycosyltransferase family 4 protein [Candidatus Methylacidiphilales bacterium]|nr:glycosyltransferase family 4 protein [Candidatus Methylacidiphilales bacterium]
MKIVLLITDEREAYRQYEKEAPYFGTAPAALLQGLEMMPELEVHIISCAKRKVQAPVRLGENIFFHSVVVPKLGWLRTAYQGCIRAARRKIKEIGPDLVHGQGTERDCSLSAVFSGYPNVITIHGNMRLVARIKSSPPFSFNWLAARLEAFTLSRTKGVVCITNYTRAAVESLARKTWVVPNAVDASFFEIKRQPATPRRILCVANVDSRKNQNALLRSLDSLGAGRNFELIFLGRARREDAYGREFFELVDAHSWSRHEGFADRETLKQHLALASGLVLPSLEDNCPMVILEAMAAGVPVAAAGVGGVPDLIRDGETGILFDPRDGKAIAAAVEGLMSGEALARASRAREEALTRFHPKTVARRHVEIYREVLESAHD